MGEMLSMIAHQWRQPLSAISAASGSITLKAKMNKLDKETAIKLSSNITNYSQHLSTTIDDFKNFFKETKIKEQITFEDALKQTLDIVQVSLKNSNIEVVTKYNSDALLFTHVNELKHVILNIIKNAEDALLEKEIKDPKIVCETYDNSLSISDNAGGIPTKIMEKIFEPYFSTKKKKDGTGLGLYMSKTIIEEHCEGSLHVTNTDDGAKFTITIA
jgi:C4-dicarboxylate-specific signal transduction histidine kinase